MKTKRLILVTTLLFGATTLVACADDEPPVDHSTNNSTQNNVDQDVGVVEDVGVDATPDVLIPAPTWENSIAATFQLRCGRCHTWALDYDLVVSDQSGLKSRIEEGHGKLTPTELADALQWLADGAPKQ